VGFIFQFYNLMPTLTAARNVELPLLLTSLSSAERKRKVAVALELVGLSDRAKHKPGELSVASSSASPLRGRWSLTRRC